MFKLRIIVASVLAFGLMLGMASSAFAKCGECHGTLVPNKDAKDAARTWTDKRLPAPYGDSSVPVYEDSKMPQADNSMARGLHGIHMNYSSATYGNKATTDLKDPNNSATVVVAGVRPRGNCGYCHNGDPRHESGFVNFTASNAITTLATQPLLGNKYLMVYTSAGRGVSYKNNISSMDSNMTGNCTTACHKGTSGSNPAPWGNFTSANVRLSCTSCHGDASNYGPSASNSGLGNGSTGTAGHKVHLYSVGGSHGNQLLGGTKIVLGAFSTVIDMNGNTNAVCAACHPDNTGEGKTLTDDGTKAYPHASDGTNVLAKNATVGGPSGITFTNVSGLSDTVGNLSCTNSCHFNKSAVQTADPKWKDTGGCELCHNHTPSAGVNISATRPLTYAHALHFQMISTMEIGSGTVSRTDLTPTGNASCSDCHTGAHEVNALGGPQLYQLPVKDGAAGIDPAKTVYSAAGTISVDGTCTNRCHTGGSPAWSLIPTNSLISVNGCASCHNYPDGNAWATINAHSVTASVEQTANPKAEKALRHLNVATAYNKLSDTYQSVTGDTNKCGKCHNNAANLHMNGTKNVNPASSGAASGFVLNNVSTANGNYASGSLVTCSNVKCHFNRETPNWY